MAEGLDQFAENAKAGISSQAANAVNAASAKAQEGVQPSSDEVRAKLEKKLADPVETARAGMEHQMAEKAPSPKEEHEHTAKQVGNEVQPPKADAPKADMKAQQQATENLDKLYAQKETVLQRLEATPEPSHLKNGAVASGVAGLTVGAAEYITRPDNIAKGALKKAEQLVNNKDMIDTAQNTLNDKGLEELKKAAEKQFGGIKDFDTTQVVDALKEQVLAKKGALESVSVDNIKTALGGIDGVDLSKFDDKALKKIADSMTEQLNKVIDDPSLIKDNAVSVELNKQATKVLKDAAPNLNVETAGAELSKLISAEQVKTAGTAQEALTSAAADQSTSNLLGKGVDALRSGYDKLPGEPGTLKNATTIIAAAALLTGAGVLASRALNGHKTDERNEMKSQVQKLDERISREQELAGAGRV